MIIRCAHCHKQVDAERRTKRYCSKRCTKAAERARLNTRNGSSILVPEPGTLLLALSGLAVLGLRRRRP